MAIIFFICVVLLPTTIFFLSRKVFDFFTVAFSVGVIYSMPLYLGYCGYASHGTWVFESLGCMEYLIYGLYFYILSMFALLLDINNRKLFNSIVMCTVSTSNVMKLLIIAILIFIVMITSNVNIWFCRKLTSA